MNVSSVTVVSAQTVRQPRDCGANGGFKADIGGELNFLLAI